MRLRLNPVRWLRAHVVTPAARRAGPGLALGLVLGLLALGPGLRRGFLLSYDMVFVPREPFSSAMFGLSGGSPRAVPSDFVVAVASRVIPADIAQKLVLLLIFMLACSGMVALLDREPLLARLAAGVFYTWNPYLAERLIIGQWALLLGYAGLPWVLRAMLTPALADWRGAARLIVAMLPAVVGGFAAMAITALVVVPVAAARRSLAAVAVALTALAAGSLPWFIPSILHTTSTDPAGVAAFAARADTPFGALGSLLMLGGMWNADTVPRAYGGAWSALWLALVTIAIVGYVSSRHRWPGLSLSAVAGLVIASLGIVGPGQDLLRAAIRFWPGFAVFRDAQQFVAPLALAEAAGFGLAVTWMLQSSSFGKNNDQTSRSDAALAVIALLAPVLLLPGLAWGAAGRLRPVAYPAAWLAAARMIDASPTPGAVLLLPWVADRTPAWNHGETMLDPWPRLLSRPVIWNDGTQVGQVRLAPDDPRAQRLNAAVTDGGDLTAALRSAGVRFVVTDADTPPGAKGSKAAKGDTPAGAGLPGWTIVVDSPGLLIFQSPG